jgi:hypothetical protein
MRCSNVVVEPTRYPHPAVTGRLSPIGEGIMARGDGSGRVSAWTELIQAPLGRIMVRRRAASPQPKRGPCRANSFSSTYSIGVAERGLVDCDVQCSVPQGRGLLPLIQRARRLSAVYHGGGNERFHIRRRE